MAFYNKNSWYNNLFGDGVNIFGVDTKDAGTELLKEAGLIGNKDIEDAQRKSLMKGLLSTGVAYLAQPKNQGYGSIFPYIGKAFQVGMENADDPIDDLTKQANLKMKMDAYQIQRAEQQRKAKGLDLMSRLYTTEEVEDPTYNGQVAEQSSRTIGANGEIMPDYSGTGYTDDGAPVKQMMTVPKRNEAVWAELQMYPEIVKPYLENLELQANTRYKNAQAKAELAGNGLNISNLNPKDFTQPSWARYVATGDTRVLDANTPETQAKLQASWAQIVEGGQKAYKEGGKDAYDQYWAQVNRVQQKNIAQHQQGKQAQQYKDANFDYIPDHPANITLSDGSEVTPMVVNPVNGEQEMKLKADKGNDTKSLRLINQTYYGTRKLIAEFINKGYHKRMAGITGDMLKGLQGEMANIAELFKVLKNREFASEFKKVKENGGGMGSLSDAEGGRFENMNVPLSYGMTEEQILKSLLELDKQILESEQIFMDKYRSDYGEPRNITQTFNREDIPKIDSLYHDPDYAVRGQIMDFGNGKVFVYKGKSFDKRGYKNKDNWELL